MLEDISKKTLAILFSLALIFSLAAIIMSALTLRKISAVSATIANPASITKQNTQQASAAPNQSQQSVYALAIPDQSQGFIGLATSGSISSTSADEKTITLNGNWTADIKPNFGFLGAINGDKISSQTLPTQTITINKDTKIIKRPIFKKGDTKAEAQDQVVAFADLNSIDNANNPVFAIFAQSINTKGGQLQPGQKLVASQLIIFSQLPSSN